MDRVRLGWVFNVGEASKQARPYREGRVVAHSDVDDQMNFWWKNSTFSIP